MVNMMMMMNMLLMMMIVVLGYCIHVSASGSYRFMYDYV
jgi:hypothetical protein